MKDISNIIEEFFKENPDFKNYDSFVFNFTNDNFPFEFSKNINIDFAFFIDKDTCDAYLSVMQIDEKDEKKFLIDNELIVNKAVYLADLNTLVPSPDYLDDYLDEDISEIIIKTSKSNDDYEETVFNIIQEESDNCTVSNMIRLKKKAFSNIILRGYVDSKRQANCDVIFLFTSIKENVTDIHKVISFITTFNVNRIFNAYLK